MVSNNATGLDVYELIAESSPIGIVIYQDMKFKYVNSSFLKMIGVSDISYFEGKTIFDFADPRFREEVQKNALKRARGEEAPNNYIVKVKKADGNDLDVELFVSMFNLDGKPSVLTFVVDISEKVQAEKNTKIIEEQIQHTQKLESLGLLAGGIAHDINNMLVGILGNASMLLSITPSDHDTYPHLKEIEKSSINISELTKQLLSFAGKGKLNRKILNVDSLIGDMFDFINLSVSKKININYSLNSQNANIYGDEIQLKQIILNLVINSSESITSKGNISIHTQIINADIDFLSQFELYDNNYKPGKYLELKIEDSGMGMTKDQLERIFDPFYTTKSTGRGLGLSVVQGIIRSQNGYIHVDSIVDKGTSFKILFPINEESIIIKEEINEFAVKSFCGKWIICDDEPLVQKVSASLLNRLSIQTILVENGENLIKYFQEFSVQINGILLDLTMPGMPLMDVFFKIREIHPEIPIILMSGHADSTLIENLVNNPKVRFMQKPFTLQQLQSNLSSLLSN